MKYKQRATNDSFAEIENQLMQFACPNPDAMTYEQLLEMGEHAGSVSKGLVKDQIKKIPLVKLTAKDKDETVCNICLDTIDDEMVRKISCKHLFHVNCIDTWLTGNKKCPTCLNEVKT